MIGSKTTRSTVAREAAAADIAAHVAINHPPSPEGVAIQVEETPLHTDLLQTPQDFEYILVHPITTLILPPTSQIRSIS